MKYLISPSKLDTFRKFIEDEYNGSITQERVVSSIKGERIFSPKVNFGSAFHAVIEHGAEPYYNPNDGKYHIQDNQMPDKMILSYNEIKGAVEYRNRYPQFMHEVKLKKKIKIGFDEVILNMRVDGAYGNFIHEHKTSESSIDIDMYYRSIQWKCYMYGLDHDSYIQYNHFHVIGGYDGIEYKTQYTPFKFYRYPELEVDVIDWIARYLEFVKNQGLEQYALSKWQ